jgi:trans-2,3-dihydro-3-hydroxyanthranilate isomerase
MTRHEYALLDVFTDTRFTGNQLAVFGDGAVVPESAMQPIAKELNLPETVFVMPPQVGGDHRLRIFTPARELPFAGHPTLGAAYFLAGGRDVSLLIEERVGVMQVEVTDGFIEMEQPLPHFRQGPYPRDIAPMRALKPSDLDPSLPIEIGSSGNAFTFVPVHDKDLVDRASPRGLNEPAFIFTRETISPESTVYGRMYGGSIQGGITEDPATGSAVGPLGAYLFRHGLTDGRRIVVEQGYKMGRPSLLYVRVNGTREHITRVHVGGRAVTVGGGWIEA